MKQGFRHIRAFLQVAQYGSFTQAAHALHISQPALTVQIRQLEEELGVMLLNRDRRAVTLTQAGRDMLKPLQRILDEFDGAIEQANDLVGLRRGRLTIAALPSIAAASLPGIIGRFRRAYPGIDIRVADVPADRMLSLVREEAADLGLGPWARHDRAIRFRELFTDQMHVFFPEGHPLTQTKQPSLKKLSAYPHVLTAQGTSVRQSIQRALEAANLSIEIACEAAYLSTAISMVKAGLGVSILPMSTLHAAPCDGVLHRPVADPHLRRRLGILTLQRVTDSPAAAAFISMALREYGK